MAENPVKAIGHLPPKRIAVVVAVGIGAGLLLRKFKGGSKTPTAQQTADATGVDLTGLALQGSSTGNLGSSAGGTTSGVTDDDGTTRQVGTISLPVVKWVVTIGGEQFLTDGTNLERIGGGTATVVTPPAVSDNVGNIYPGTGAKGYNPANLVQFVSRRGGTLIQSGTPTGDPGIDDGSLMFVRKDGSVASGYPV